jgi:hypothetical protein
MYQDILSQAGTLLVCLVMLLPDAATCHTQDLAEFCSLCSGIVFVYKTLKNIE